MGFQYGVLIVTDGDRPCLLFQHLLWTLCVLYLFNPHSSTLRHSALQMKKWRLCSVKLSRITCLESIRGLQYSSDRDSKLRSFPLHLAASNSFGSLWNFGWRTYSGDWGRGVFLMFLSHITLVAVSSLHARLVPAPGSWDGLCESPRGENIVLGGLSKPIKFGGWCKLLPVSSLLAVFGNRDKVTW